MVKWLIRKIVGSKNQRVIKKMWPEVQRINALEEELQQLPESALLEKTARWRAEIPKLREDIMDRVAQETRAKLANSDDDERHILEAVRQAQIEAEGEANAAQAQRLEEILHEAFAVVKNASRRLCGQSWSVCDQDIPWDMVHFDVQLIGGMALHRGAIAEMATGEGKTLVASLPIYLNALTGRGVHLITVNDYLARRDSEWVGHLFKYLGLSVGCIQNSQHPAERREQYEFDITYGTSSEFGFDYLRDNGMSHDKEELVQRGHYFCLIDEVDSVLIDEARVPLIISGPVQNDSHQYDVFKPLVDKLVRKQKQFCDDLVKQGLDEKERGELADAGQTFLKVKMGQPRNEGLLRAMEDTELRREVEKAELALYQDPQKRALFAFKEELFFTVDERSHDADLSEKGREFLNPNDPDGFVLPDLATEFTVIDGDDSLEPEEKQARKDAIQTRMDKQAERIHNISQLLKAYCLYETDVEYVVEEGKVVIVDQSTGRKMPGRRWSDGLHQAVEAKEGVKIDRETQTLATITIQNYFRMYEKLGGMTGTAETEASEFLDIYGLEVLPIPTNKDVQRLDENDCIYKTAREKFSAVVARIKDAQNRGQPVLAGTASVEASEVLSRMLKREKIPHAVLNAKFHMQEAEIVARAGQRGAVTVSTNMAGRGTDIKLGEGVADLGGLLVVGTERHEARRTDRQLRGRCARQGDPGQSIFFISFEDSLMRNFGAAERMTKMMERFGLEEGQELQHPWLNKSVETAQKRVESRNYLARKHVLEYDDVMNQQRNVVYGYRTDILNSQDVHSQVIEVIDQGVPDKVLEYISPEPDKEPHNWDGLLHWINSNFPLHLTPEDADLDSRTPEENIEFVTEKIRSTYELKAEHEIPEALEDLERFIVLHSIDKLWQDHLYSMDGLREGIRLRSYGQKDPLVEYKNEAYAMFTELMAAIRGEILSNLFRSTTSREQFAQFLSKLPGSQLSGGGTGAPPPPQALGPENMAITGNSGDMNLTMSSAQNETAEEDKPTLNIPTPIKRESPKVGRNDPCPCGSGKKYKQCCGRA